MKCIRCSSGYLLSKDTLNPEQDWVCSECGAERYGPDINKCVDLMQREIDNLFEKDMANRVIDELESMYIAYKNVLHDGHYIMQTMRFHLVSLYSTIGGIVDISILRRNIEFCDTLLKVSPFDRYIKTFDESFVISAVSKDRTRQNSDPSRTFE